MSVVANDAARARNEFGYTRMWSIHPEQIEAIVAAFAPRDEEIATATEILLAAQSAQWGPTRHHDTLHDRASYRVLLVGAASSASYGARRPTRRCAALRESGH